MENVVKEMRVIVDLNLNFKQESDHPLMQICDGFAKILRQDIHVSQIICSSKTKQIISKFISDNEIEYQFEDKLFGATYTGDETIKYARIILFGRRD